MEGWRECTLGDVVTLIGGGTPKTNHPECWGGDIPWLSVVDFNNDRKFVYTSEKHITKQGLENSSTKILKKSDIIISARGTVGVLAVLAREMSFNQSCYGIRAVDGISIQDFMYYCVKNCISDLIQKSHGGVFDTITRSTFEEIDLLLPPPVEQQAIAAVLSSLDDKIDLLHRQNKTLEALAQTLFRQWFVEEAAPDVEASLSDFAENIRENVTADNLNMFNNYIGLEHIEKKQMALYQHGNPEDIASNKSKFLGNDILFGKLRPYFHKVTYAPFDGICSTDILVIRPLKEEFFAFCLCLAFSDDFVQHSDIGSEGTRMPRTNWNILSGYRLPKPDLQRIRDFNVLVMPSITKMTKNISQIHTLTKLRDTLLPKLMSGEVRVSDNVRYFSHIRKLK